MKIRIFLAALAASFLLSGCFRDFHELDPSKNVGYVVPELQWADPDDAGSDIHDLLVVVNSPEGAFSKHYSNVRDLAREPLEVPVGETGILVLANATEADGIRISNLPATKFTLAEMLVNCAIISVLAGKSLPVYTEMMASSSTVYVQPHALYTPAVRMQEVFPSLSMTFANIPEGICVEARMDNMADGILLSGQEGAFAAAGPEAMGEPVLLKTFSRTDDHLSGVTHPTVAGAPETGITLIIRDDAGGPASGGAQRAQSNREIKVYAPRMDCGKKYTVTLDFKELVPDMHLGAYKISDWEIGFAYDGRVY